MSLISTEEIITKLSSKFNRIFYDREFICSVQEDFEVILKNTKRCCVVIFPVLGPHYLKAVHYQARILNLAAFTLGTDRITSVAVCHRDFLMKKLELDKEKMQEKEPDDLKTKQKRPERQLYVPPAQRSSRLRGNVPAVSKKKGEERPSKDKKLTRRRIESTVENDAECEISDIQSICSDTGALEKTDSKFHFNGYQYLDWIYFPHTCWEYGLYYNNVRDFIKWSSLRRLICLTGLDMFKLEDFQIPVFSYTYVHLLFTLKDDIFLWQPGSIFNEENTKSSKFFQIYPPSDFSSSKEYSKEDGYTRLPSVLGHFVIHMEDKIQQINHYCDLIWVKKKHFDDYRMLNAFCDSYYYFVEEHTEIKEESFDTWLQNLDVSTVNNTEEETCSTVVFASDNGECEKESKQEDLPLLEILDSSVDVASLENNASVEETTLKVSLVEAPEKSRLEYTLNSDPLIMESVPKNSINGFSQVIVPENSFVGSNQNISVTVTDVVMEDFVVTSVDTNQSVEKDVPKNHKAVKSTTKISNDENKTNNKKTMKSKDEHDEEKEIMRKTKENINRKSRPIMKYVDNTDELKIGEDDDNVNNWEDLFDESGQLHENIMKEIFQKVGNEVTIVKAKEDYSDYSVKQLEELEHMVELYDFPEALETNDLIHAFRDINSDAMYIKWVDNTHAILVLGSLTQAQKAMSKNHPLIKVRPMSAASNASLSVAYKNDLKPAMKRPQTNLQTARRMITTHLGKKSNVTQERSAKERSDLKQAKEMKRLIKKNEEDAWEGNLRSSLN